MSNWAKYGEKAKTMGGSGLFVKLTSGQAMKFLVISEVPHESHKLFPEGGGTPTDVEPGTAGADVKIMLAVFDVEAKTSKILQLTPRTFTDLAEKMGEFGADHVYRLKRTGEGMKTKWHLDHVDRAPEGAIEMALAQDPIDLEQHGGRPMAIDAAPPPATKPLTARRQVPEQEENVDDIPF